MAKKKLKKGQTVIWQQPMIGKICGGPHQDKVHKTFEGKPYYTVEDPEGFPHIVLAKDLKPAKGS